MQTQKSPLIVNTGAIASIGDNYTGAIKDTYGTNYIGLPTSGAYAITVQNNATGGQLRASVVADLGDSVQVTPLSGTAGVGASISLGTYTPPGGATSVVLVIINQVISGGACANRAYMASVTNAVALNEKLYLPLISR